MTDSSGGIVLFDGACAFCESAVVFVARRDPDGYFRFGASQTLAGQELLEAHGLKAQSVRTLVLIEEGNAYLRSTAVLRIARRLTFPWKLFSLLLVIPQPVRDPLYRLVAAIRHELARESAACGIPPPEIRNRLI